ncbi:Hypothetical protein NTJ_04848 [Nesidiocoris tenuis]|uniref:PDZ domain-containing protein n=1 Tax=Nesidiocoris tenuis TaxID=355587 RepID=A0ABN7AMB3_9HEMI|nr:Hypothetical protein NTJ_04848 [Nesidiocoris tenuis]
MGHLVDSERFPGYERYRSQWKREREFLQVGIIIKYERDGMFFGRGIGGTPSSSRLAGERGPEERIITKRDRPGVFPLM